ncbi:MAG: sigma-70 family RNA polymerase sigma factor [Steroidobacteraceae bacterium]|nr:sigma-70 family RNA polymerase sigma factor [Steroidobacteraceae bacterium]
MSREHRQQQFEQVLADHGPALARLAAAYERRPALREELLQDIAVALWQALPSFRGDASMKTFVLRVATNRAMTHLARRPPPTAGLDEAVDLPADGPSPEVAADVASRNARLMRAVEDLPLPMKQVMSLALEGLPPSDIAAVLGLSESNVGVRLHRAKAKLRAALVNTHE